MAVETQVIRPSFAATRGHSRRFIRLRGAECLDEIPHLNTDQGLAPILSKWCAERIRSRSLFPRHLLELRTFDSSSMLQDKDQSRDVKRAATHSKSQKRRAIATSSTPSKIKGRSTAAPSRISASPSSSDEAMSDAQDGSDGEGSDDTEGNSDDEPSDQSEEEDDESDEDSDDEDNSDDESEEDERRNENRQSLLRYAALRQQQPAHRPPKEESGSDSGDDDSEMEAEARAPGTPRMTFLESDTSESSDSD